MADLLVSFKAKISHGALLVRDLTAEDDISDWDADSSNWYQEGNSVIFGVAPAVDGLVEVEVWKGSPPSKLDNAIFETELQDAGPWLVVHDSEERVRMEFRSGRGAVSLRALGDDLINPSRVQIIVELSAA
ncbi:hypothetical protein [Winogradskya humida]|uniref:Uncharacterized protein n=1 Tax=Winogradskya humida TaxID=113566 RepID=A0ABQ4A2Q4_9ACTN|nr:hypothetical protein [Actinoplanes humidus]GIE25126.1 hypothetical protein Ahu01nite_082280 [Actinoplanes humidus]